MAASELMRMIYEDEYAAMREELIERIEEVAGSAPPEVRKVLKVLTHPEIVPLAANYIKSMDTTTRCLYFEPPWNCAREAESKYENIQYGWGGAGSGVGYDDNWCANCTKRVMDS